VCIRYSTECVVVGVDNMANKKKQYNDSYVESTRQDLRRLQHWFAGFKAAGGKVPQCIEALDCLQASILILSDYGKEK
jgi:hypothetical protein